MKLNKINNSKLTECNDVQAQKASRRQAAIEAYKKYAHVETISENLDEWALNEVACKYHYTNENLKNELLKEVSILNLLLQEDISIDQAARDMEAQDKVAKKSKIEDALDRSLRKARAKKGAVSGFPNILLVGDAGFGKTEIVIQWAKDNGINLVYKDAKTMNASELGGMVARDMDDPRYATRIGNNEFAKSLSKPNSVLFLDEYNRAKQDIRASLLTLVQNHIVWDPNAEGEQLYLENFLFTIAAMNPANNAYPGARELDGAERSRFRRLSVQPDPEEHLNYLEKYFAGELAKATTNEEKLAIEGRLKLARTILKHPDFYYDTETEVEDGITSDPAYIPLNYRSFKEALEDCDGTKDDLLYVWNDFCNHNKKQLIADILEGYEDVQDKANDVISGESDSELFKSAPTIRSKLRSAIPGIKV